MKVEKVMLEPDIKGRTIDSSGEHFEALKDHQWRLYSEEEPRDNEWILMHERGVYVAAFYSSALWSMSTTGDFYWKYFDEGVYMLSRDFLIAHARAVLPPLALRDVFTVFAGGQLDAAHDKAIAYGFLTPGDYSLGEGIPIGALSNNALRVYLVVRALHGRAISYSMFREYGNVRSDATIRQSIQECLEAGVITRQPDGQSFVYRLAGCD